MLLKLEQPKADMPRKIIYEGKAKKLFEGPEPGTLIQHFKDDATAFNNEKKGTINGKGVINNRISEYLFLKLRELGIPNHFIKTINMREQLIKAVQIVPLEVIVRNHAAGSFCKRFHVDEGKSLGHPLIEFCFKNDDMGDPFVSEEHIFTFQWATPHELDEMRMMAFRINDFLTGLFMGVGLQLVDFKLEFGRLFDEGGDRIILADEISPDNCRLWDTETGEKLDKDRFRQDLGDVEGAYQEVARRLGVLPKAEMEKMNVAKKKATAKKKPAASRKAPAKKPAKKKVATKKPAAKKATSKKSTAKKTTAKRKTKK